MDPRISISLVVLGILGVIVAINGEGTPFKKFEYKFSFKPPYLAQKDGSVPFWEYRGSKFLVTYLTWSDCLCLMND